MFGSEKAVDKLTAGISAAIIEGFERGARIIANKLGEIREKENREAVLEYAALFTAGSEGRRDGAGTRRGRSTGKDRDDRQA